MKVGGIMSFVRAKEIPPRSGNWYDYEVETVHEGGKVRQKVIQYIGKTGTVKNPVLLGSRSKGIKGELRDDSK